MTSSAAAAATPPHLHAGKFSADTSLSREQYYIDVDFLHEYMASNWITSRYRTANALVLKSPNLFLKTVCIGDAL